MEHDYLIIERLKRLKAIQPDPGTLKWARRALLADIAPERRGFFAPFLERLTAPSLHFALSGIAALALIISAANQSDSISGSEVAGLDAERAAVAKQNLTPTVNYMKGISPTISLAITDIVDPSTDYGSAGHIKKGIALLDANR